MNTRETLYVKDGNLYIGGFRATELAARFGTPLYVMDARYISEVCDAFVAAVSKGGEGSMMEPFLKSAGFQQALRNAVLDVLRSPEGQELLAQAVKRQQRGY